VGSLWDALKVIASILGFAFVERIPGLRVIEDIEELHLEFNPHRFGNAEPQHHLKSSASGLRFVSIP